MWVCVRERERKHLVKYSLNLSTCGCMCVHGFECVGLCIPVLMKCVCECVCVCGGGDAYVCVWAWGAGGVVCVCVCVCVSLSASVKTLCSPSCSALRRRVTVMLEDTESWLYEEGEDQ